MRCGVARAGKRQADRQSDSCRSQSTKLRAPLQRTWPTPGPGKSRVRARFAAIDHAWDTTTDVRIGGRTLSESPAKANPATLFSPWLDHRALVQLRVKVRQLVFVDAVVVGVTGHPDRPGEVVLARRDEAGALRQVGLSLPLSPLLSRQVGERVTSTGEPLLPVSTGVFGRGHTEYHLVQPDIVVEIEAAVRSMGDRIPPHRYRLLPPTTQTEHIRRRNRHHLPSRRAPAGPTRARTTQRRRKPASGNTATLGNGRWPPACGPLKSGKVVIGLNTI